LLKQTLGFDEAFNYNEEKDLNSALKRLVSDGRRESEAHFGIKVRKFNWIVFDVGLCVIL